MESYTIIGLGIIGYIAYSQFYKRTVDISTAKSLSVKHSTNIDRSNMINTYPTGTQKFTTQVMAGPNVSFMTQTY